MLISLPQDFYTNLSKKYDIAINNGHMKFNGESAVNNIYHEKVNNTTFDCQLTFLKTLMYRPEKGEQKINPFAEPEPELTILDDFGPEDEFKLVYNKYPVVPKHFMMITKEFISQNTPLNSNELLAIYSVLQTLKNAPEKQEWIAFYNCGEESGASQPHKHVQFISLPPENFRPYPEDLISTSEPFIPSTTREPLQNPDIPFAHFVAKLPNISEVDKDDLTMIFSGLLQRVLTVLRENEANHISYNCILTTNYMMLVPRKKAKYAEKIGINSCGILGLFLCPSEETFNLCKEVGPLEILKDVGFPNTAGQSTDEYHY